MKRLIKVDPNRVRKMNEGTEDSNSFLSNVRERISLRIKIEWLHLVFRFKYPETTTEPIKWLSNYNEYLRKCHKIREKMNAL
jgi:hypothetical protein